MEPQKRSWLPHKVCFQILLKSLQTNIQVPHIRWKSVPKTRPRYRETSIAVALESPGRTDEISSSSWTKVLTTGRWSHVAAWFSKICRSCTDQAAPDEKTDLELNALVNREPMQVITQDDVGPDAIYLYNAELPRYCIVFIMHTTSYYRVTILPTVQNCQKVSLIHTHSESVKLTINDDH